MFLQQDGQSPVWQMVDVKHVALPIYALQATSHAAFGCASPNSERRFRPLACTYFLFYRFVNTIAVCVSGADAACMVVLTIAAMAWEGTEKAKRADSAVVIIQMTVLVGKSSIYLSCGPTSRPV